MVQTMESPPFDLHAYQPPISLWEIVKQHVPVHEREEIKNMLGESLIDQSMELHEEVNTLLEIWREYRDETTKVKPAPILPEPPGLRDRLVQEIQFFVESVKEKAKNEGVNADKILSRHNTEIIDYALDTHRPDSARPSSRLAARGSDGRETPMICSPSCSDRTSEASILSEEVEAMNEKLNVLKFDEVVAHLRTTLEEEIETLMKDINFLQNCLDEEATFRAESTGTLSREPTLHELKEERSTLEKDLLSNLRSQASPPNIKPAFNPDLTKRTIGGLNSVARIKSSGNSGSSYNDAHPKPGPLKAFSSPEPPKGVKTVTSTIRPNSGVREKVRTNPIETGERLCDRTNIDSLKSHLESLKEVRQKVSVRSASDRSQGKRHISDSSHIDGNSKNRDTSVKSPGDTNKPVPPMTDPDWPSAGPHFGKALKSGPHMNISSASAGLPIDAPVKSGTQVKDLCRPSCGPQLEAVLTLSKGKSGDATDVHQFMPSPPSSNKPSTPRPSSAQRFRNMVLDCRESS